MLVHRKEKGVGSSEVGDKIAKRTGTHRDGKILEES